MLYIDIFINIGCEPTDGTRRGPWSKLKVPVQSSAETLYLFAVVHRIMFE